MSDPKEAPAVRPVDMPKNEDFPNPFERAVRVLEDYVRQGDARNAIATVHRRLCLAAPYHGKEITKQEQAVLDMIEAGDTLYELARKLDVELLDFGDWRRSSLPRIERIKDAFAKKGYPPKLPIDEVNAAIDRYRARLETSDE